MATKTKIVPRLFANYCGLTKQSGLSNGHVDFLGARCSSLQSWRSYTAEQRAKTKSEKKHSFSDSKVMGIEMLRNPKANKVIIALKVLHKYSFSSKLNTLITYVH